MLLSGLLAVFTLLANDVHLALGIERTFWLGMLLQLVGWGIQVGIGHGYFEVRVLLLLYFFDIVKKHC